MNREADDAPDPEPVADPFEAIVARWRREGAVPSWPVDDQPSAEPPPTPSVPVPPVRPAPAVEPEPEADHFVPPEPPPLPRIGPPALVGFALLALGLALVTGPGLLGVSDVYGLPLGLLTLAAGLGWLVLRLWPAPFGERDADDDGAQV